jgi:hypothetical protein
VIGQLHTLITLLSKNRTCVDVGYEAGWVQQLVWALQRIENLLPMQGLMPEVLVFPACNVVAILTELLLLLKYKYKKRKIRVVGHCKSS